MYIEEYVIQLDGTELRLRNAREEDAEMLIDYLKQTCGETRFLVKEPEEITLTIEQEKNFIRNQNESEGNLMLLAFLNGKYIGNCSLMGSITITIRDSLWYILASQQQMPHRSFPPNSSRYRLSHLLSGSSGDA